MNKSPRTVEGYLETLGLFRRFLAEHRLPQDVTRVRREHVDKYLVGVLGRNRPGTAATRYKGLRLFFSWLVAEGEIEASPMANIRPPAIPETVPVLTEAELKRLIKTCSGKTFDERRDLAIMLVLIDTGMRRSELAALKVTDIDWDAQVAVVIGKGRRPRACPFGKKTALALDRYVRARDKHRLADRPELWLGLAGPLTGQGVRQLLDPQTGYSWEAGFLALLTQRRARAFPLARSRGPSITYHSATNTYKLVYSAGRFTDNSFKMAYATCDNFGGHPVSCERPSNASPWVQTKESVVVGLGGGEVFKDQAVTGGSRTMAMNLPGHLQTKYGHSASTRCASWPEAHRGPTHPRREMSRWRDPPPVRRTSRDGPSSAHPRRPHRCPSDKDTGVAGMSSRRHADSRAGSLPSRLVVLYRRRR